MREKKDERRLCATWMGVAGFLISDGCDSFYIDPFVSRYSIFRVLAGLPLPPRIELVRRWIGLTGGASAKAVVVSHSHFDHALDAPFFAGETGAVLVGSESTASIGLGAGLGEGSIKRVRPGDTHDIGDFRVRFVKSVHGFGLFGRTPYPGSIDSPLAPPAPAAAYRLGEVFSLVIEHPLGVIIHHGSAGRAAEVFYGVRADMLLLCAAGRGDTAGYLEQTAAACGAKTVVPMHFDNFFSPLEARMKHIPFLGMEEFVKTAAKVLPDAVVAIPEPGRALFV